MLQSVIFKPFLGSYRVPIFTKNTRLCFILVPLKWLLNFPFSLFTQNLFCCLEIFANVPVFPENKSARPMFSKTHGIFFSFSFFFFFFLKKTGFDSSCQLFLVETICMKIKYCFLWHIPSIFRHAEFAQRVVKVQFSLLIRCSFWITWQITI